MTDHQSNPPPANPSVASNGDGAASSNSDFSGTIPRTISTFITPTNRIKYGFASSSALSTASDEARSAAFEDVKRTALTKKADASPAANANANAAGVEPIPDAPMDSKTKTLEELCLVGGTL